MYYIVYGFLYLLSLLPWWVIYLLSDLVYLIVYHIAGYRKKVVFGNLRIAFPDKTEADREKIAKRFYRNLIDTFIEMIKLISISKKEMQKRFTSNIEVLNDLYATGQNVEVVTGHFFNWEMANLSVGMNSAYPFVVVYMPLSSKVMDRVIYKMRARFGSLLVPATEFKNNFHKHINGNYALILVADQNPGGPEKAYWVDFFSKPAPFVRGPETGAKKNNAAIIYADFYKIKRGYYRVELELVTTDPKSYEEGKLTHLLVKKVEASVRKRPDNYLWSHRRWKFEYDQEKFGHLKID